MLIGFISCEHEPFEGTPLTGGGSGGVGKDTSSGQQKDPYPCDPDSVYFVNQILPIIRSN